MSKIDAFIFTCVFMLIVSIFGGYAETLNDSISVSTAPGVFGEITDPGSIEEPNEISGWSWAFNSLTFMFDLSTFQIDGCPAFFSFVAIIVDLIWFILLILIIRGN